MTARTTRTTTNKTASAKQTSESTELEARKAQELAMAEMYAEDAGAGIEQADSECYAIPFIKILQKLSPEVDPEDAAFIDDAKPNMFFNTASQELYPADPGIGLIPCHFQRRFLKWKPRSAGGGYQGSLTPEEFAAIQGLKQDEHGRFCEPNGDYYADTREHYCLLIMPDRDPIMALVSMGSTQIKKSKNWISAIDNLKVVTPKGRIKAPSFARMYNATTVLEKNDQGSWHGWKIVPGAMVTDPNVYAAARQFRESIISGKAKAAEPESGASASVTDDDVAF